MQLPTVGVFFLLTLVCLPLTAFDSIGQFQPNFTGLLTLEPSRVL